MLSHDSVGGFLSHSGWSCVVEAVQFGKSLILLSFLAETGLNCRVLKEKKMAYLIPRDEQDGLFTRDSVVSGLLLLGPVCIAIVLYNIMLGQLNLLRRKFYFPRSLVARKDIIMFSLN
ncbi:UDP-glycosyltransferase 91A1 [Camellia lanceoleosa]|uniref:UDP-glycosyltransferase 91A1 n=1 Tax=Camellia lanceoleosa TaxID=1840588 RepID=A0ACC0J3J6_9ERIC|nr:UDP-glycosyltransferase 91A1 [Camellia lanceoleosa]